MDGWKPPFDRVCGLLFILSLQRKISTNNLPCSDDSLGDFGLKPELKHAEASLWHVQNFLMSSLYKPVPGELQALPISL